MIIKYTSKNTQVKFAFYEFSFVSTVELIKFGKIIINRKNITENIEE